MADPPHNRQRDERVYGEEVRQRGCHRRVTLSQRFDPQTVHHLPRWGRKDELAAGRRHRTHSVGQEPERGGHAGNCEHNVAALAPEPLESAGADHRETPREVARHVKLGRPPSGCRQGALPRQDGNSPGKGPGLVTETSHGGMKRTFRALRSAFSSSPRRAALASLNGPGPMKYYRPVSSSAKLVSANEVVLVAKWVKTAQSTELRTKENSFATGRAVSSHTDASLTRKSRRKCLGRIQSYSHKKQAKMSTPGTP